MSTVLAPAKVGICRIPHELELFGKSRFADGKYRQGWFYPETTRLSGDASSFMLTAAWQHFLANINTVQAYTWLANGTLQKGWSNFKAYPWVERLTAMGNKVRVVDIVGNRAYIDSYHMEDMPPDLSTAFYDDCKIHQFWTENNKGDIQALPCGSTRILVIGRNLWIDKSLLTFMDDAPVPSPYPKVMRVSALALPWLNVRTSASTLAPVVKKLIPGTQVMVLATSKVDGNTWAQTVDGWMAMYYRGEWYLQ